MKKCFNVIVARLGKVNMYITLVAKLKLQPSKLHKKIILSQRADACCFDFAYFSAKLR